MCENLHVAGLGPKVAQHHSYIPLASTPVLQEVFPKGKANGYPTEAFLWLGMTCAIQGPQFAAGTCFIDLY